MKTSGQVAKLENAKNQTVRGKGCRRHFLDFSPTLPRAQDKAANIIMTGPKGFSINEVKFSEAKNAKPLIATSNAMTTRVPSRSRK
jgi:hypothetical protein